AATSFAEFNLFVPNIATMIGVGVGIDYALFVVTRYREELARTADPPAAVAAAVATAGRTVFFSGATVLLSLAGLLVVNARIFRELAAGAMTAVAVMVLGALTLVPPVLAWIGPGIERFRVPGWRGLATTAGDHGFWARWARTIMARPWLWTAAALVVLLALASPVTRLQLSLDTGTGGIEQQSAAAGREILEREFNEGRISPLQIVYVSRDGPLDDGDLDAVARLSELLTNDWAVVEVTSVTTLLDRFAGDHSAATLARAAEVPQAVEAASGLLNLEQGADTTVIRAVPRWSPDSPGPIESVVRIRDRLVPAALEGQDAEVVVGGLSAQIVDITAESERKLPVVVGLVVVLSFLLLAVVFRSLVLPAKAIVLNGLGIAAAYGLLVVVFQEGAGARLFDFEPTGTTQVYLPLLTFAVLFGLSMDYEVFLLSRIKEEWERTGDNRTAVARGLQRTAGVITSAAAIMVAVFAAFVLARLTEVKALGFSLAVAVLIDATIVRIVLVPAAMQLMGSRNWWFPAWLDRIVPRVDLSEGEPGETAGDPGATPSRSASAPPPPRAAKG
ncbi:MAG: MMPL family transporter, partial [Chloroflexia bacterium]|nr:MMPL family transporter [Chloroflexia bacterium]